MKDFYLYALREPETREIRYVGYSFDPLHRLHSHLYEAEKLLHRKTHKLAWIRGLIALGLEPILTVEAGPFDGESLVQAAEIDMIQSLTASGVKLTNTAPGGAGVSRWPDDMKQRVSESLKRNYALDPTAAKRRGVAIKAAYASRTPEQIAEQSVNRRQGWAKMTQAQRDERIQKMVDTRRKRGSYGSKADK